MGNAPYQSDRAREVWWRCLHSAFRSALACTIVGCATLYTPPLITHHLAFPAFSYVTVILIVTDASLGDTVRGCWLALYATVQSVGPAILTLWVIGPDRLSVSITALAVAISAFAVVLPESTHLIAKRIALGQIVIVYVIAYINGAQTQAVMHPVRVAASTALGVVACVLALLVPYPSLACCEVKHNSKLFAENASQRLHLLVKAFCAEDSPSALPLISQAKLLAIRSAKYLQIIKTKQESMQWERLPLKFLKPYFMKPGDKLQEVNVPLRGMEIALTNPFLLFPVQILDQDLKDGIHRLEGHIGQTLKKVSPSDCSTIPEPNAEINIIMNLQAEIPRNCKDLSSFFFLFCLELLQNKSMHTSPVNSSKNIESITNTSKQEKWNFQGILNSWALNKRFILALKSSTSLGLAVLFGLIYSKENGYWSGLPVAISLASAREATFKVANVKAQGTVLGTVYGVLGCFVFQRFVQVRFLSLLPWFIFSSFLRHSLMYGQAGGLSAIIGAVLILGRKDFGPPSDFAIARIVETFIGLSCSIMVEILLQPTRSSNLAKTQLSKSLHTLHECFSSKSIGASKNKLEDSQKRLKAYVNELRQFIGEAELEPNFWFLPFPSACYRKLLASLSKMEDLLLFSAYAIGFLEQESGEIEGVKKLEAHLENWKKLVCSSIKCFEEVTLIKSIPLLEKELQKKNISCDLELGKSQISSAFGEDEIEKMTSAYLQDTKDILDEVHKPKGENELKTKVVLSSSALAFCMGNLVRETQEIKKGIEELLQWENPSNHINLHEISCKIHALYS